MAHTCELCGKDYAPDETKSGEQFCSVKCQEDYQITERLKTLPEGVSTITGQTVKVVSDPRV
jgi:hypothetical protein